MGVRGSAAASIILYSLGITDIDPLRHDLVFERFLNVERREMPDIDMDFADNRRDEVIRYVADKYGRDRVAQIITFGTLGAKAALRDTGRALGAELQRDRSRRPAGPQSAQYHAGERPGAKQRAARSLPNRCRRPPPGRHRPAAGRGGPPRRHPRRGRGHLPRAPGGKRPPATPGARQRRRHPHDPMGHEPVRRSGLAQDGLPGPQQPHHPGNGRADHPRDHRRDGALPRSTRRRPPDLRRTLPRRDLRRLPVGSRPACAAISGSSSPRSSPT